MNVQPRLLLLETSGRSGLVGLALADRILGARRLDEARRNARDLAPAVRELLQAHSCSPREINAVVVSRGPGSYTGLRVGIISAKAFAYASGCTLVGIDTFTVIAEQAPPECSALDVLADAQQDKVYQQSFRRTDSGWQPVSALSIRRFADWLASRTPDAWVGGPGLIKWQSHLPADIARVAESAWQPGLACLLRLGLARYQAGECDDVFSLEPLYLRASSAEEQWDARGQKARAADRP